MPRARGWTPATRATTVRPWARNPILNAAAATWCRGYYSFFSFIHTRRVLDTHSSEGSTRAHTLGERTGERANGRTDERTNERAEERKDGRTDGRTNTHRRDAHLSDISVSPRHSTGRIVRDARHQADTSPNRVPVCTACSRGYGGKKHTARRKRTRPRPKHFWDPYCSLNALKVVPRCARTCLRARYRCAAAGWPTAAANRRAVIAARRPRHAAARPLASLVKFDDFSGDDRRARRTGFRAQTFILWGHLKRRHAKRKRSLRTYIPT